MLPTPISGSLLHRCVLGNEGAWFLLAEDFVESAVQCVRSMTCVSVLGQVRQHTHHKRTFMFLEQLILKHGVDQSCVNIKAMHEVNLSPYLCSICMVPGFHGKAHIKGFSQHALCDRWQTSGPRLPGVAEILD